ncbi:ADP-ribosyltransferase [Nocardia brasiliensis]|uniref:ADP-ribosyltransferase n=1 Tax=Nocardia brasiliensis TaxID=37326 RepID=UPI002456D894|nr:ADP-ribosyltransferase [Nocardia brasiliensis]
MPDIRTLTRLLEELRTEESKGALPEQQAEQFEILNEIFSHPFLSPSERWAIVVEGYEGIDEMSTHFPALDGPFDGDTLQEQVELLTGLTEQPLSITEPMRVVHDLDDIDFLSIPWGPEAYREVIGTTVTPDVFLVTTAKGSAPRQETEHRLLLTVHPGADGLAFGDAAQPRLLLPPGTPLRITDVRPHGDGYRIEAEVGSSVTGSVPAGRRSADTETGDEDYLEDGSRDFDTASIVSTDSDASSAWPGSIRETRTVEPAFGSDTETEGRINGNGVRVFDTDQAGDAYGSNRLRNHPWDEFAEPARRALIAHGRNSVLNNILRSLSDIELDQLCARIERNVALYRAIVAEHGTEFVFGVLRTRRAELAGRADLEEAETELLNALTEILDSENPARRWADITADAHIHQDAFALYLRPYGPFGPDTVRAHREGLDNATGRPLPSTEPFRVLRTLESVDFLLAQDGEPLNGRNVALLVGVRQREPGYLSTSLTAKAIQVSRFHSNFVLELEVTPGARGVYVGSDGGLRQNELLFARNTGYQITGIGPTINGVTTLYGRIDPDDTAARHPACAPSALRYAADKYPGAPITVPAQDSVGLDGMSAERFNRHAGGELRTFTSHAEIEEDLRQLGAGAFALVVDAYHGPVDEHGIGAHTVVFENDHMYVHGYDPITESYYPLDLHPTGNVRAITAIVYRPDGSVYTADRPGDGAAVLGDTRIGAPDRGGVAADNRATEPMDVAEKRDRFGMTEFLGGFDGATYPSGTKLRFHAADRTMHAEFGDTGVKVSWTGNRATPAPSEHAFDEFWHLLRTGYERLGFTEARVAQPPFQDSVTDRILGTAELRKVLSTNSLDTETEIHFQDDAGHRVAVVRRDGNLAVRDPHTAGDLPPSPREIISRNEFLSRFSAFGVRHVRVSVPTPLEWYRVPSTGPGNLYPTLARILTVDAEVVQRRTEQKMAATGSNSALVAAAEEFGLNFVFTRPGEPRLTMTNSPRVPKFFLRQTPTGYEVGVTATGHFAAVVTPDLSAAKISTPPEQIPAPRTTMLAGGPEPPLNGAAVRPVYIQERRPVSARAPKPAVIKNTRRKRTTWIRNRTVPAAKLEGRRIQSAHLPRPTLTDPTPVHYMDEVEREAHRLYVDKTGRLRHARDGSLFQAERNEVYLGDRKYIFVMDEFGNLYAAEKIKGLIQHSSFLGGRIVTAAGAISAKDGIVTRIVDSSGHYAPDEQTNDYALAFLEAQGLRFSDDFQRVYYSNNDQFRLRAPAVQERVRAAALARAKRVLSEGPTVTAPFKVYRTETTQRYLSWRDFPPGTTIGFQDALFDTTATVTDDLTFRLVARSIDGSRPDLVHELGAEALRELVSRLDVGAVRVERPEVPVYTYYGEDLLRRMKQGEADFHADSTPTPGDQRAPPPSHEDQPAADRTMPPRWEPVRNPGDPGFAAIAQVFGISEAAQVRQHILNHLREEATIEHERREEVDDSRVVGEIDDAEWQDELRDRHEFDRWRSNAHWDMVDPAAQWQAPDFDAGDRLLRLVAAAYGVNFVSVHPDGQVREIIHSADQLTVFLRRTAAGHFEIGATATGAPFVVWPQQRVWDELATPDGQVPADQIPAPLRHRLTKPHLPLLAAAVPNTFSEEGFARPVHYMDADELESHRLFVGPNGRLHRASDGARFDTSKLADWPGPGRRMLFVVDEFGNLYAGVTEPSGRIQHASFSGGRAVSAAGEIHVIDGMLSEWSDDDRQGPPHPTHNDFALDWLRRRGLALDPGFQRTDAQGYYRDRFGEPLRQRTELTYRRILAHATDNALHHIENRPAQSPAARAVTEVARAQLATEQRRLRRWRQLFHERRISKTEQVNSFAHPAPAGANDRLIPPGSINALTDVRRPRDERAAWWEQRGRVWWSALQFADLEPGYQERLLADYPGLRNGDGIPAEVRNTLNRRHILLQIAGLQQATAAGVHMPAQQRRLHHLETTLTAVHLAELEVAIAAQRSGGAPATVRLQSFHQDLMGRGGSVTIAFGPVDTAVTLDREQTGDASFGSLLPAIPQVVRIHGQNAGARSDHATVLTLGRDDSRPTGQRTSSGTTGLANDGQPPTGTASTTVEHRPAARRPTTAFEPEGGETYFGALLESLRDELDGPTHPSRTRVVRSGQQRPSPAEHQARLRADPPPEVPVTIGIGSRLHADGRPALTLVDEQGHIAMLPASGRVHAVRVNPTDGSRSYFELSMPNGQQLRVPEMLVRDFQYVPGSDTTPGILSWQDVAEIRLVGYDRQKVAQRVTLQYQDELVVQPPSGQWRFFAKPDTDELTWFTFYDPNNLLPEAPELRDRRDEDLFGAFGPQPQDAVQGAAGYCSLIAPLKQIAQHDPASIEQMLHDNGDGTVYVRLRVDDTIEWELVEKSIHVTPGTEIGHYIRHEPGQPLWPAMIAKAYAQRFGGHLGYIVGTGSYMGRMDIFGHLDPGFSHRQGGTLPQPTRVVQDYFYQLHFDPDTLKRIVGGDPEFRRRVADLLDELEADLEEQFDTADKTILTDHPDDAAAREATWDRFENTEALDVLAGFRSHLDRRFPGQWETEKNKLIQYFAAVYDGPPENRLLDDGYRFVGEAIAERIDWALRRGPVILGTNTFGGVQGNTTAVPGLVGNHSYAVLAVVRDAKGTPTALMLEDPGARPRVSNTAGIEYQLPASGSTYTTEANGTRVRIDPDGSKETFSATSGRYWRDADGEQRWTSRTGAKMRKPRGGTQWTLDPTRKDPPDGTIPRHGVVQVDLRHLPKFNGLAIGGPAAYGLYGPEVPTSTSPSTSVTRTGHSAAPHTDRSASETAPALSGGDDRRASPPEVQTGAGTHAPTSALGNLDPRVVNLLREAGILSGSMTPTPAHVDRLLTDFQAGAVTAVPIDTPAPPRAENAAEVSAYAAAVWAAPSPQVALALVARLDSRTVAAVRAAYPGKDLVADLHAGLPDETEYIEHVFAAAPTESEAPLPAKRERSAEVGDSGGPARRPFRPTAPQEPSAEAPVEDGSAAHVSPSSTPDVHGNCGPLALQYAADRNPGTPIRRPVATIGLSGMRGEDFESAAAAPLQPVGTPAPVVAELRALGPGALSLVVDVHAGPDARGFGAHAVVLYEQDGELRVHDPVTGDHALTDHPIARSRSVLAIVYADDGSVRTLAGYSSDGLRVLGSALIGAPPFEDGMDYSAGFEAGHGPAAGGPRIEVFHGPPESFPEQFRFDAEFGLYPPGSLVNIIDAAGTLQLTVSDNGWVTANYGDSVDPGPWVETFAGDSENAAEHVARHLSALELVRIEIHYPTPQPAAATWVSAEDRTAGFPADSSALPGDDHTDASRADARADMESWVAHGIIRGYTNRDILDHLRENGFTDLTKPQVDACVQDLYASAGVDYQPVKGWSKLKQVENFARNYPSRIDQDRLDALPLRARRLERAVFGYFRDHPNIEIPNKKYYETAAHALTGAEVDGAALGGVSADQVKEAVAELLARVGIPKDDWIKHPVRNIMDPRATLAALAHGLRGRLDRAGVAEFMRSDGLSRWSTLMRPTPPSLAAEIFEYLYEHRNNPSAVGYESISAHLANRSFGSVSRVVVHDTIRGIIRKIKIHSTAKRLGAAESPANKFLKIAAKYPDAVEAYRASRGEPSDGSAAVPAR